MWNNERLQINKFSTFYFDYFFVGRGTPINEAWPAKEEEMNSKKEIINAKEMKSEQADSQGDCRGIPRGTALLIRGESR